MPAALDQRDLRKRHPLCPSCDYDLVATLAANRRICPECGEEFELGDLKYEWRQGDWSNTVAIRRGLLALCSRLLIGLFVATLLSAAIIWTVNHQMPRPIPFLLAVAQAFAIGVTCSRRLLDQAGYESILLIIGACLVAAAASALGFLAAAQWIVAPRLTSILFLEALAIAGAWAFIVHALVMDAE